MNRRQSIYARIKDNVKLEFPGTLPVHEGPCWIWQGGNSGTGRGGGYGRMSMHDRTVAVHRVMATHEYGFIPPHMHVDHRCENRLCCNPRHLEVCTHKKNQRRRAKRSKTNGNPT